MLYYVHACYRVIYSKPILVLFLIEDDTFHRRIHGYISFGHNAILNYEIMNMHNTIFLNKPSLTTAALM